MAERGVKIAQVGCPPMVWTISFLRLNRDDKARMGKVHVVKDPKRYSTLQRLESGTMSFRCNRTVPELTMETVCKTNKIPTCTACMREDPVFLPFLPIRNLMDRLDMTFDDLAEATGLGSKGLRKARNRNRIRDLRADHICMALDLHPIDVYGDVWIETALAPSFAESLPEELRPCLPVI